MNLPPILPFAMSPEAIRVDFVHHAAYLEAVVSGFKSPAGVAEVIVRIGQALRKAQLDRVLIDVRRVAGQMSTSDHAGVGAALARSLGRAKCAVVARADRPRGEIAPSAQAGGVDYCAFDDTPEAVQWLTQ